MKNMKSKSHMDYGCCRSFQSFMHLHRFPDLRMGIFRLSLRWNLQHWWAINRKYIIAGTAQLIAYTSLNFI